MHQVASVAIPCQLKEPGSKRSHRTAYTATVVKAQGLAANVPNSVNTCRKKRGMQPQRRSSPSVPRPADLGHVPARHMPQIAATDLFVVPIACAGIHALECRSLPSRDIADAPEKKRQWISIGGA
jgi:hypothetical protein